MIPSSSDTSRTPPTSPLDSTAFPHILERVLDLASFDALIALRATSRALRDRIDTDLFAHVVLVTVRPRYAGAKTGVGFTVPASGRLLPCIPSVRQLPRPQWPQPLLPPTRGAEDVSPDGPSGDGDEREMRELLHPRRQSPAHLASNRRMMSYIQILDSATDKLYDMPTLPPPPLVRKCTPTAAGVPGRTVVETFPLTSTEGDHGRLRHHRLTPAGTFSPSGGAGASRANTGEELGAGTFVAHFTFSPNADASAVSPRGVMLSPDNAFQHLVLVLPGLPDGQWDMSRVVRGVRFTVLMALTPGGDTRLTIVGVERFGAHHFGVADSRGGKGGVQGATRRAILEYVDVPDDERLKCTSWEEWVEETRAEVALPPPSMASVVM